MVAMVMGSALASTVCQAVCASRDAAAAATATTRSTHHACHEQEAPPAGVTLTATPHACGHEAGLQVRLDRALQALSAPAEDCAMAVLAPVASGPRPSIASLQISPPDVLARTTQLRI